MKQKPKTMNCWRNLPDNFSSTSLELFLTRKIGNSFIDIQVEKKTAFYEISVFYDGIFTYKFYCDFYGEILFHKTYVFSEKFIQMILQDGQKQ